MEKRLNLLLFFVILVCGRKSAWKDTQNFATNRKTKYGRFSISTNQPIQRQVSWYYFLIPIRICSFARTCTHIWDTQICQSVNRQANLQNSGTHTESTSLTSIFRCYVLNFCMAITMSMVKYHPRVSARMCSPYVCMCMSMNVYECELNLCFFFIFIIIALGVHKCVLWKYCA